MQRLLSSQRFLYFSAIDKRFSVSCVSPKGSVVWCVVQQTALIPGFRVSSGAISAGNLSSLMKLIALCDDRWPFVSGPVEWPPHWPEPTKGRRLVKMPSLSLSTTIQWKQIAARRCTDNGPLSIRPMFSSAKRSLVSLVERGAESFATFLRHSRLKQVFHNMKGSEPTGNFNPQLNIFTPELDRKDWTDPLHPRGCSLLNKVCGF